MAEIVERGDRRIALPRGRQTTHGTMWIGVVALMAAVATMSLASSRPAHETVAERIERLEAQASVGPRFTANDGEALRAEMRATSARREAQIKALSDQIAELQRTVESGR